MKTIKPLFLAIICAIIMSGCASLKPAIVTRNNSLDGYQYVYITPTAELTSSTGSVYGNNYGTYGLTQTKSINPSDVIAGYLLKKGFTRVPKITPELKENTLIVNYGESGRRNVFWGYTIEITIQFLSAKNHSVLCVGTAEGMGDTETDDIRIAINRCLDKIFSPNINN